VSSLRIIIKVVADLGGECHLVETVGECLPEDLLGVAVAVHIARIEVGDSLVDGVVDHPDSLLSRAVAPPVGADDPRAESDLTNLDTRIAEFSLLHGSR